MYKMFIYANLACIFCIFALISYNISCSYIPFFSIYMLLYKSYYNMFSINSHIAFQIIDTCDIHNTYQNYIC